MEDDIRDTIAKLVRKADSNFERELKEQEEALRTVKCINPYYGEWLDMGVELLFSIFRLEDQAFVRQLPELAHLSKSARHQLVQRLETHLHDCDHCALKQQYELALNASIETVCRDNRDLLVEQLEAELSESKSQIDDDDTGSYSCSSKMAIGISGARQFRDRQHPRRGGH